MLLIGFAVHFWAVPKEGLSELDIAAANVARMEASASGHGTSSKATEKPDVNYLQKLKDRQEKQLKYLTIIAMVLGVVFLVYSFIKKETPIE
jgi:hypothetical protein